MKYSDTISTLSDQTDVRRKDVEAVLDRFAELVRITLTAGGEVSVPGLGKFKVKHRGEAKGRNLRTGEELIVPPKVTPRYRPARALVEAMNAPLAEEAPSPAGVSPPRGEDAAPAKTDWGCGCALMGVGVVAFLVFFPLMIALWRWALS